MFFESQASALPDDVDTVGVGGPKHCHCKGCDSCTWECWGTLWSLLWVILLSFSMYVPWFERTEIFHLEGDCTRVVRTGWWIESCTSTCQASNRSCSPNVHFHSDWRDSCGPSFPAQQSVGWEFSHNSQTCGDEDDLFTDTFGMMMTALSIALLSFVFSLIIWTYRSSASCRRRVSRCTDNYVDRQSRGLSCCASSPERIPPGSWLAPAGGCCGAVCCVRVYPTRGSASPQNVQQHARAKPSSTGTTAVASTASKVPPSGVTDSHYHALPDKPQRSSSLAGDRTVGGVVPAPPFVDDDECGCLGSSNSNSRHLCLCNCDVAGCLRTYTKSVVHIFLGIFGVFFHFVGVLYFAAAAPMTDIGCGNAINLADCHFFGHRNTTYGEITWGGFGWIVAVVSIPISIGVCVCTLVNGRPLSGSAKDSHLRTQRDSQWNLALRPYSPPGTDSIPKATTATTPLLSSGMDEKSA